MSNNIRFDMYKKNLNQSMNRNNDLKHSAMKKNLGKNNEKMNSINKEGIEVKAMKDPFDKDKPLSMFPREIGKKKDL